MVTRARLRLRRTLPTTLGSTTWRATFGNGRGIGTASIATLTLTRKAARWRGLAALIASIAGVSYAAFNAAFDHAASRQEDRVEALERKVDAVSEDIGAIKDALAHDRAAP